MILCSLHVNFKIKLACDFRGEFSLKVSKKIKVHIGSKKDPKIKFVKYCVCTPLKRTKNYTEYPYRF